MLKINIKSWLNNSKDRKKIFRTIAQIVFILVVSVSVIKSIFGFSTYKEEAESKRIYDNGFIAISYFGVDRSQKSTLIDDDMLKQQLEALKALGYVTISQQDILDYYNSGKKLPEKAMFLSFEDGRRDSALFTQPILEELNYRASMFTYANKFEEKDFKFLQPEDLLKLKESTYWELGSNGYRFSYINVFDRYGHFLDTLNQDQFNIAEKYVDGNYNHYLMDFIKDQDRVTIETRDEMDKRITWDYNQMKQIYSKELGYVPSAYMFMHANSFNNGKTNQLVESVNKREIKDLFQMNFNKEGKSLNSKDSDLFKLSRLQAKPYWYTNHLLMRIGDDTKNEINFIKGDEERASNWTVTDGAAEFNKGKIILTSPSASEGKMILNNSYDYGDFKITTSLEGNVIGKQSICLRYNQQDDTYTKVSIEDNKLHVAQKTANNENELLKCDLRELLKTDTKSINENITESEAALNEIKFSKLKKSEQIDKITEEANDNKPSIDIKNGEEEYIPKIGVGQLGKRKLEIAILGNKLDILVDGVYAVQGLELNESNAKGAISLESMKSEQNLEDNVYDGVFNDFVIEAISKDKEKKELLFDNRLKGIEKTFDNIKVIYSNIINWFIENF